MASETPKATDVIWINLDEYYYVCDSCSESWRGTSWFPLTSFANNWEERNKPIYEELEGSDRPCDLCRYDIDEFVQEVIDRNLDPEEIPEVIKGDVLGTVSLDPQL